MVKFILRAFGEARDVKKATAALSEIRRLLFDEAFKGRHRVSPQVFTRHRKLSFPIVVAMVLRKSLHSLQNVVNEALSWLGRGTASASAFCQARYRLRHTAFIELNQVAVLGSLYGDGEYARWRGFRLLAVDGSKVLLPDHPEIRDQFGTIAFSNGRTDRLEGERTYGLASVLYDVCNRVAVDATLARGDAYEVDLAVEHLAHACPGDWVLADRNYPAYRLLAEFTERGIDFVVRCSAASFKPARRMLRGEGPESQIVTLTPCAGQRAAIRRRGLPTALKVRFVRVILSTGEYEVLVTSLRDETRWPTAEFRELYHLRWGVETFYGVLKTRLTLENFTGIGAEAIRQDFFASVFLGGLESLLVGEAQTQLDARPTRHPQQVNRAVAFNAIKHKALALLCTDADIEVLCAELTALFLTSPCSQRPGRNPPRNKKSDRALLDYHRRRKKHCF